jgi:hypothetical protein
MFDSVLGKLVTDIDQRLISSLLLPFFAFPLAMGGLVVTDWSNDSRCARPTGTSFKAKTGTGFQGDDNSGNAVERAQHRG